MINVNNKQQFLDWFGNEYPTIEQLEAGWYGAIDFSEPSGVIPESTSEEKRIQETSPGIVVAAYSSLSPQPDLRFEEYSINLEELELAYNSYLDTL